ncbi:MAG: hypothetical protein H6828_07075 [Planctomycetes bacterium]|nr:hypothetical protein [Planctomycetota bacterium]
MGRPRGPRLPDAQPPPRAPRARPPPPGATGFGGPLAQFAELRDAGHLAGAAPFTRCLRCNAPLAPLPRADAAGRVPPRVHAAHTEFFTCPRCAAVFWRGSHVRTTCRSLGLEDVAESGGAGARPAAPDAPA